LGPGYDLEYLSIDYSISKLVSCLAFLV